MGRLVRDNRERVIAYYSRIKIKGNSRLLSVFHFLFMEKRSARDIISDSKYCAHDMVMISHKYITPHSTIITWTLSPIFCQKNTKMQ